ncbi:MAG: TPM domain-containing protein [Betaproteobacteria bacterium]|nr:TPM domain-containing protein [Betaproteobacteria bacterium]
MNFQRILRHLLHPDWMTRRAFPRATLEAIARAVTASEGRHSGEIRFVVEGALHPVPLWRGRSARDRAIEVFSDLRVWDTETNNGVLIYVLLADRDVEIVADRGLAARVPADEWETLCRIMEGHFARGEFAQGALAGVNGADALLRERFPSAQQDHNELPDAPAVL